MKALVVYATITGNNEDVADIITDALLVNSKINLHRSFGI